MDEDQELAQNNDNEKTKDQEMTEAKNEAENSENETEDKEKSGEPKSPS